MAGLCWLLTVSRRPAPSPPPMVGTIPYEYWRLQGFHIVNRCGEAAYSAQEWLPVEAHGFRLGQINPSREDFICFSNSGKKISMSGF